jgi:hypothetical protein
MIGVGTRGIRRQTLRLALGLAWVSLLSGCAKNGDPQAERVCDRDAYARQSHEYRADDGGGIDHVESANPTVEGYFGKRYNRDWLAAVGHASILDTLDYIQTKGVRVYHSDPISGKSALNLESTAGLPWDLDRVWRSADQPASDAPCGFLAGLYLAEGSRGLPSLKTESAIIVREDAGRWTLVHEFMHHNFKTQARAAGYDDGATRNLQTTLLRSIQALWKNHSISDVDYAKQLSPLFQRLAEVMDQMVIQYQFEEVTIEATLQDRYEKGELGFVPSGSYANATWYIAHSKKSVEDMYRSLDAIHDELARLTSTNGLWTQWKALARYVTTRDRRLAQLDAVIARRQSKVRRIDYVSTLLATPRTGYAPCAHAQQIDDALNEIAIQVHAGRDRI